MNVLHTKYVFTRLWCEASEAPIRPPRKDLTAIRCEWDAVADATWDLYSEQLNTSLGTPHADECSTSTHEDSGCLHRLANALNTTWADYSWRCSLHQPYFQWRLVNACKWVWTHCIHEFRLRTHCKCRNSSCVALHYSCKWGAGSHGCCRKLQSRGHWRCLWSPSISLDFICAHRCHRVSSDQIHFSSTRRADYIVLVVFNQRGHSSNKWLLGWAALCCS